MDKSTTNPRKNPKSQNPEISKPIHQSTNPLTTDYTDYTDISQTRDAFIRKSIHENRLFCV
jgi:hypothetical protein